MVNDMADRPVVEAQVAVVGGGISGLATAYWLAAEHGIDVVVLEADARLGGKVSTRSVAGLPVDTGPDAFLSRAPTWPSTSRGWASPTRSSRLVRVAPSSGRAAGCAASRRAVRSASPTG